MPYVVRGTKKRVLIVAYKGKRDKLYDYILGYCREHGDIDPNNVESLVNAATVDYNLELHEIGLPDT